MLYDSVIHFAYVDSLRYLFAVRTTAILMLNY